MGVNTQAEFEMSESLQQGAEVVPLQTSEQLISALQLLGFANNLQLRVLVEGFVRQLQPDRKVMHAGMQDLADYIQNSTTEDLARISVNEIWPFVQKMMRYAPILTFGKHRGKNINEVPDSYLEWAAKQPVQEPNEHNLAFRRFIDDAKAELKYRQEGLHSRVGYPSWATEWGDDYDRDGDFLDSDGIEFSDLC